MKRVSVFIDGNNFYYGLRKLYGLKQSLKNFDFEKFSKFLAAQNELCKIFYYNAQLDKRKNPAKYESQKKFLEKLRKIPNLNLVLCKLLKRRVADTNQFYYIIKEDDISMAVDIVEGACSNDFDIAVLVSGDGDFVPAVKAAQRKNKSVTNVYFRNSSSRNLKSCCNNSLELTKDVMDIFLT